MCHQTALVNLAFRDLLQANHHPVLPQVVLPPACLLHEHWINEFVTVKVLCHSGCHKMRNLWSIPFRKQVGNCRLVTRSLRNLLSDRGDILAWSLSRWRHERKVVRRFLASR
jgi:hypothetical protein